MSGEYATIKRGMITFIIITMMISIVITGINHNSIVKADPLLMDEFEIFYTFDEGEGQFCNEMIEDNPGLTLFLGENDNNDTHDPFWSPNTNHLNCLFFNKLTNDIVQSSYVIDVIELSYSIEFDLFPSNNDQGLVSIIGFNDGITTSGIGIFNNNICYFRDRTPIIEYDNTSFIDDMWIHVKYIYDHINVTETVEIDGACRYNETSVSPQDNRLIGGTIQIGSIIEGYNYYNSLNGLLDNFRMKRRGSGVVGSGCYEFARYDFQYLDSYENITNIVRNKAPSREITTGSKIRYTDGISHGAYMPINYSDGIYNGNCLYFNRYTFVHFPYYNRVNYPFYRWTFECWLNPLYINNQPSSHGVENIIFSYSDISSRTPLEIGINYNHKLEYCISSNTGTRMRGYSSNQIDQNKWTHIALTFNKDEIDMYINFIHDSTHTLSQPPYRGQVNASIGKSLTGGGCGFIGFIDDVRIYYGIKKIGGQMALYQFDDQPNKDSSPHSNHLTGLTSNDLNSDSPFYSSKSLIDTPNIGRITSPGSSLCPTKEITIQGWIKLNGEGYDDEYILDMRCSDLYSSYAVKVISESENYYIEFVLFIDDDIELKMRSKERIVEDKWYHYTCTYNRNNQRIAINGRWDNGVHPQSDTTS